MERPRQAVEAARTVSGLDVIRVIEGAAEAAALAPVLAVRAANRHETADQFLYTYEAARHGVGYFNPDAPHIRRRANANRERNRLAGIARRANR